MFVHTRQGHPGADERAKLYLIGKHVVSRANALIAVMTEIVNYGLTPTNENRLDLQDRKSVV